MAAVPSAAAAAAYVRVLVDGEALDTWEPGQTGGGGHGSERLIREGGLLGCPDLERGGQVAARRFRAGTGDLFWAWVNAGAAARSAHAACHFQRQRARAAADIQHLLARA